MKKNFYILLLIFLWGCNSSNTREIKIFNQVTYKLEQNEKIKQITPSIQQEYLSYFYNSNFQVPLFRYIQSDHYKSFIGIPYQTTIKQLIDWYCLNPDSCEIITSTDSISILYRTYKSKNKYIAEQVLNKNNNIIIITTDSLEFVDKRINQTEILKRFKFND